MNDENKSLFNWRTRRVAPFPQQMVVLLNRHWAKQLRDPCRQMYEWWFETALFRLPGATEVFESLLDSLNPPNPLKTKNCDGLYVKGRWCFRPRPFVCNWYPAQEFAKFICERILMERPFVVVPREEVSPNSAVLRRETGPMIRLHKIGRDLGYPQQYFWNTLAFRLTWPIQNEKYALPLMGEPPDPVWTEDVKISRNGPGKRDMWGYNQATQRAPIDPRAPEMINDRAALAEEKEIDDKNSGLIP